VLVTGGLRFFLTALPACGLPRFARIVLNN
jgi:hypothetical protein